MSDNTPGCITRLTTEPLRGICGFNETDKDPECGAPATIIIYSPYPHSDDLQLGTELCDAHTVIVRAWTAWPITGVSDHPNVHQKETG